VTNVEMYALACTSAKAKTAGKNTQYEITETDDTVYLAIQGSCDLDDWKFNFSFWLRPSMAVWKKPYRYMRTLWFAHWGFVTAWKLAREQIMAELEPVIRGSGKRLVILGYSHGAALAVVAHEDFKFNGYEPKTHAFGCPRVLWMPSKKIRERFEGVTLYQSRGDLVTHVPFVIMGFRHVGKVLKFGPKRPITHLPHTLPNYRSILA